MKQVAAMVRRISALVALGTLACQAEPTGPGASSPTGAVISPFPIPPHLIGFLANYKLYTIWDDGTHLKEIDISPHPPQPMEAHWSPTWPNRIAYVQMWDYGDSALAHVFVINTDGSGMQDLTPAGVRYASGLAWSPDGSRIAFRDQQRLMVVNVDGTGLDTIATNPQLRSPVWMPDGQHILYFAGIDIERTLPNERGIWSVKYDGTGRVKIRTVPASDGLYGDYRSPRTGASSPCATSI